ncbi:hypothetical protein HELRODRAFT_161245 [Helobdella robusta]|uniref:Uncharacterized protein n=1 Tax=Helobdella robusta TaxID=6412 RepID=T1ER92_HELRO|nr:hypothetical protein HELRODRAFT_161245 [Helobdella robusta]ESO02022.1 hypothetical protein HELRODRAFT_161245 [Helobdella robusta]
MGQQGSHNGADHPLKSAQGSSDLLDSSFGSQSQHKIKIFKNLRNKNKSTSSAGSKHSKKLNNNHHLNYNGNNALTSSPIIKKCVAENINAIDVHSVLNDESLLHNVTDSLNSSTSNSEQESSELNDSNKFMCNAETFSNISDGGKCIFDQERPQILSAGNVEIDLVDKDGKVSPGDEMYVDAKDQQSPNIESTFFSASENRSSSEISLCDRPTATLSSTTLIQAEDLDKNCSMPMASSMNSDVTLPEIVGQSFQSLKIEHKCVETKPYIVTSRLLSVSGIESNSKNSSFISHKAQEVIKDHGDFKSCSKKNKCLTNMSGLINSKFGFSLESGMEVAADYKSYNSVLHHENIVKNSNVIYNSLKQSHKNEICHGEDDTNLETVLNETDKCNSVKDGTIKNDYAFNQKRFRYNSESSNLSESCSSFKKSDRHAKAKCSTNSLSQVLLEEIIQYPRMVPEKLDFKQLEKFEGQMLISWLCSCFQDSVHYAFLKLLSLQELKLLVVQFCTHLLAAGVIRKLDNFSVPYETFRTTFSPKSGVAVWLPMMKPKYPSRSLFCRILRAIVTSVIISNLFG